MVSLPLSPTFHERCRTAGHGAPPPSRHHQSHSLPLPPPLPSHASDFVVRPWSLAGRTVPDSAAEWGVVDILVRCHTRPCNALLSVNFVRLFFFEVWGEKRKTNLVSQLPPWICAAEAVCYQNWTPVLFGEFALGASTICPHSVTRFITRTAEVLSRMACECGGRERPEGTFSSVFSFCFFRKSSIALSRPPFLKGAFIVNATSSYFYFFVQAPRGCRSQRCSHCFFPSSTKKGSSVLCRFCSFTFHLARRYFWVMNDIFLLWLVGYVKCIF